MPSFDQSLLRNILHAVGELVVKVGDSGPGASVEELLVEAGIEGARLFGTERPNVEWLRGEPPSDMPDSKPKREFCCWYTLGSLIPLPKYPEAWCP